METIIIEDSGAKIDIRIEYGHLSLGDHIVYKDKDGNKIKLLITGRTWHLKSNLGGQYYDCVSYARIVD